MVADEQALDPEGAAVCNHCDPHVTLNLSQPQRTLEHVGAHILFDPAVKRIDQPCGLCLRPSSMCQYYLLKGKGTKANPRVDMERSAGCPRLVKFQWGKAAVSEEKAPCSNVPLLCPLCPKAVWRYNLRVHLSSMHSSTMVERYRDLWDIESGEIDAMRHIWNNRKKKRTKRKRRADAPSLVVSEVHTSIEALRRLV